MKVHVYGRVSKSNGDRYGESNIDIQFDECKDYCMDKGWSGDQIIYHVQEGTARRGGNIPELNAILDIMDPGDVIIVYAIDRLSRSTLEGIGFLERLVNKGCRLESVYDGLVYDRDETNDKLIHDRHKIRAIINYAELESDIFSVRARRANRYRAASKKSIGPTLSSTRFQCRKRRRSSEVDETDVGVPEILDDHMDIEGVATRSMINRSKRRRIEQSASAPAPADMVRITTRSDRIMRNNLLRGSLERYGKN